MTNYSSQKLLYNTKFSIYASAYVNDNVEMRMEELKYFNIEGIHTFVFEIEKAKKEAMDGEKLNEKNEKNADDILNNVGLKLAERTFEQKLKQNGGNV